MSNDPSIVASGLRARKKRATRSALQQHALRLFLANGYQATTVEAIAQAADVSPMTFYRYFPTKEDVVLADEYDPLIVELITARPADEPALDTLRHALGAGFATLSGPEHDILLLRTRLILGTPALRARLWEQQGATADLIARALVARHGGHEPDLATRVVAAAGLAAVTTALAVWVDGDGRASLPTLVDRALTVLQQEGGAHHG